MQDQPVYKEKKKSLFERVKRRIYFLLRLIDHPVVKVYTGYGNADKILVIGHVWKLSPMPRKTYRNNWITNFLAVIRLFMVKPYPCAAVTMQWDGQYFNTETESDGFFKLEINPPASLKAGWYPVCVELLNDKFYGTTISGTGRVYIPSVAQHGFISDIDDTFLVSHSARIRRRLYVLFTKNARTRKLFDGVIHHYSALAKSGQQEGRTNPFFYVSSSEWNLYDFIMEFARFNDLPKGIFLLGQMKQIKDFWKSGQNNHATKFMRIVRIIEQYPAMKFVLLGDDSQQDPYIYHSLVKHFPDKILAVYLRRIHAPNYDRVIPLTKEMEACGVSCCYFEHSSQAMIHSRKIGLVTEVV